MFEEFDAFREGGRLENFVCLEVAEFTKRAMLPGARGRQPLRKTAPAAVKLAKRLSERGLSLRR